MTNFFALFGIISTVLVTVWAVMKYIILGTYRLDNDTSKRIVSRLKKSGAKQWVLNGEYVIDPKYPDNYSSLVYLGGALFYFSRAERLLTAGWKSKEEISYIIFPRWWRSKIEALIRGEGKEDNVVPVMALLPGGTDRLGELMCDPNPSIFLTPEIYSDIEEDVVRTVKGIKNKTGCLLYGPPGSGKTQFVKYLARKYSLPIYVVYFNPDYNNHDIAVMFASIPGRCIVLMEDFDSYFDGRECSMKNESVKFTFDALINALDGVHNDYNGVIFVMTANDISKIDESLKTRPSRYRFVREFTLPDDQVRMQILGDEQLVEQTRGMTLDQVFSAKPPVRE